MNRRSSAIQITLLFKMQSWPSNIYFQYSKALIFAAAFQSTGNIPLHVFDFPPMAICTEHASVSM